MRRFLPALLAAGMLATSAAPVLAAKPLPELSVSASAGPDCRVSATATWDRARVASVALEFVDSAGGHDLHHALLDRPDRSSSAAWTSKSLAPGTITVRAYFTGAKGEDLGTAETSTSCTP